GAALRGYGRALALAHRPLQRRLRPLYEERQLHLLRWPRQVEEMAGHSLSGQPEQLAVGRAEPGPEQPSREDRRRLRRGRAGWSRCERVSETALQSVP